MSSLKERLAKTLFFSSTEDAVSAEIARNREAAAKVAAARLQNNVEEREHRDKMKALDDRVKLQRDAYAKEARPLLSEFDELCLAQHYYDQVENITNSGEMTAHNLLQRELGEFGYLSKKAISVSLSFEALKQRLRSGLPYAQELNATLQDAESESLNLLAAPLQVYAEKGIPAPTLVRVAAFELARAIEDTGKELVQEPVRGWLDFLKFKTYFSPAQAEHNQVMARRTADKFIRMVEMEEYHHALEVAEEVSAKVAVDRDASQADFQSVFDRFREVAIPTVASNIFLTYSAASITALRYAYVEGMLKDTAIS